MFCPAGGAFFIFIFSIFAGHCDSITTSFALSSKKHRLIFFPLL